MVNLRLDKSNILIIILGVIAAALVVGILVLASLALVRTSDNVSSQRNLTECLTNWANVTTGRTSTLTRRNQDRLNRLDIVIRDVALGQSKDPKVRAVLRTKFYKDITAYVKASDRYNDALKAHPIPRSPKLACPTDK